MSHSFQRVDYSLRPSKHAERKMLCEVFRRLRPFQPVEDYVYVGFGSIWFSDFILFHRSLGIKKMISIEQAVYFQPRFDLNKPYECVQMDYRASKLVLPELDWQDRYFFWMDYDDPISKDIIQDVALISTRAKSGTVLAVSVQCHAAKQVQPADEPGQTPLSAFRNYFGPELVSPDLDESDLSSWRFGALSRKMLEAQIQVSLGNRNLNVQDQLRTKFVPICSIDYEDGAKMTTIVGIFAEECDTELVDRCGFTELDFLPTSRHIKIEVPVLTVREIRHIERQLPLNGGNLNLQNVPEGDAKKFAALYRYLPNFGVLES